MVLSQKILLAFLIKHFFADYYFNPAYVPACKHIYGSKGSLYHVLVHSLFCGVFLVWFVSLDLLLLAIILDALAHYHIDYVKSLLLSLKKWPPRIILLIIVFDQVLHLLTYFFLIWFLTNPQFQSFFPLTP